MKQAWEWLSARAAEGHLRPVIGAEFPMEKVGEAYRLLAEGKNFGKVVLKIN
jgi:NADPH:quinone reductase-like Zn-dependent oxidoreductase